MHGPLACPNMFRRRSRTLRNGYPRGTMDGGGYRTKLDSHANMPMLGRHSFILNDTGQTVEVNPFTPQYKAMTAKLVDGALLYDCPYSYSGKSYVLVVQNAIHVPSMDNNLIPLFMMREAWIMVNEKARIHMDNPKDLDHSIMFNSTGFWIPLYLWGIFSYFSSQRPTKEDLLAGHDIYVLSPSKWDPHSEVYGQNEANMTSWEGNVKEPKDRLHQVVIDEIATDIDASQFVVSSTEANIIDKVCNGNHLMVDKWQEGQQVPKACDDVSLHLGRVSSVLVDSWLAQQVEERMNLGHDQIAIGSTVGMMDSGNCQPRQKHQCGQCINLSWMSPWSYPQRSHRTISNRLVC